MSVSGGLLFVAEVEGRADASGDGAAGEEPGGAGVAWWYAGSDIAAGGGFAGVVTGGIPGKLRFL